MRIPSQFNDETLYGRRGQRSKPAQSYRRVIRLSVVLALVVVVMRQASQPQIYETFFGEQEIEQEQTPGNQQLTANQVAGSNAEQFTAGGFDSDAATTNIDAISRTIDVESIDPETLLAARLITQAMNLNEQRQWTVVLDHWQSGEPFPLMRSVIPSTVDVVASAEEIDSQQREQWTRTLTVFGRRFANTDLVVSAEQTTQKAEDESKRDDESSEDVELKVSDVVRLNAWLAALDQAAVDRVVDGAIWRSEDFDAFYRQLDQADKLNSSGAVSVAVVPLMQQPQVYLGKRVRVAGRVARSELKQATANPFGVTEYWQLWVRPSDGGDRPFVLIVPEVPDVVKAIGPDATASKGPEIRVVGRFFKRLAYGSSFGADAAPVVIGRILGQGRPVAATNQAAAKIRSESMGQRLLLTLAAALIVGIAFAAIVMWRTAVTGKRSRELRTSHRQAPDSFLGELADHHDTTGSNEQ